jgi:pyrroline-5-carboxylate reductase
VKKIAIIGAGNMGAALLGGLLKAGRPLADLVATTGSDERADRLRETYPGLKVLAKGNIEAVRESDVIVLGVKPFTVPKVMDEIAGDLRDGQVIISLAAALPIAVVEKRAGRPLAVFRAMPNIPVVVEEGAIALCYNAQATAAQKHFVEDLFKAVGVVCFVEEDMMDAVTALSGSGPAYVYMVIEAFIAGGVKMGLSREVSTRLAEQTVLGAAKHVRQSGKHPAILRDEVITPGGTTIVAIHELERHGLRSMLISAIETATHHARDRASALVKKLDS